VPARCLCRQGWLNPHWAQPFCRVTPEAVSGDSGEDARVGRMWSNIERNRQTDALAERLELRFHAIAIVVTATVLAMRLIAGTQDLTSDSSGLQGESSSDAPNAWLPSPPPPPL
jgi:hypothetical protein